MVCDEINEKVLKAIDKILEEYGLHVGDSVIIDDYNQHDGHYATPEILTYDMVLDNETFFKSAAEYDEYMRRY